VGTSGIPRASSVYKFLLFNINRGAEALCGMQWPKNGPRNTNKDLLQGVQ
jgi:hypothetical protein